MPPVTLEYVPPAVADTCHWFVIPPAVDIPVAVKTIACPQTGATIVEEATGAGGVPLHGTGGVQVYVKPEAGFTVLLATQDEVAKVPATEAAQLVVVDLLENPPAFLIPT